jgi:hypothetical protein
MTDVVLPISVKIDVSKQELEQLAAEHERHAADWREFASWEEWTEEERKGMRTIALRRHRRAAKLRQLAEGLGMAKWPL